MQQDMAGYKRSQCIFGASIGASEVSYESIIPNPTAKTAGADAGSHAARASLSVNLKENTLTDLLAQKPRIRRIGVSLKKLGKTMDGRHNCTKAVMKIGAVSLFLLSARLVVFGQVTLTTGQSYVFSFTLPYVQPANGEVSAADVYFSGGAPGQIWYSQTDFFANSLSDPPFFSYSFSHTGLPFNTEAGWSVSWPTGSPPPWPYLQGLVRVTDLGGTFNIDRLYVQEDVNRSLYEGWFYAVPEPSVTALLAVGLGGLVLAYSGCLRARRGPFASFRTTSSTTSRLGAA